MNIFYAAPVVGQRVTLRLGTWNALSGNLAVPSVCEEWLLREVNEQGLTISAASGATASLQHSDSAGIWFREGEQVGVLELHYGLLLYGDVVLRFKPLHLMNDWRGSVRGDIFGFEAKGRVVLDPRVSWLQAESLILNCAREAEDMECGFALTLLSGGTLLGRRVRRRRGFPLLLEVEGPSGFARVFVPRVRSIELTPAYGALIRSAS